MQSQTSKFPVEPAIDHSIAKVFFGSGLSLFGFLLFIALLV